MMAAAAGLIYISNLLYDKSRPYTIIHLYRTVSLDSYQKWKHETILYSAFSRVEYNQCSLVV